jgi:hypothetical protein
MTTPRDVPANWIPVTDDERAALVARAEYLRWIDRGNGYRYDFVAQLQTDERINPYLIDQLAETSPAAVRRQLEPRSPGGGCDGRGYYWLGDTDYPCGGCYRCKPVARPAAHIGCFIYNAGTFVERVQLARCVLAMECLAAIGAAIEAALGLGREVAKGFEAFVTSWNVPMKGAWYRVTGTRGRAAEARGAEGECVYLREQPRDRYGSAYVWRLGLQIKDREGLVYVNAPSVERIPVPADVAAMKQLEAVAKAAAAMKASVRPEFQGVAGRNGDIGCVISGPHKGKQGVVFWKGIARGEPTAGLTTATGEKLWVGIRDVVAPAARATVEADIAELLFVMLAEAGFEAESTAYGKICTKLEGRVVPIPTRLQPTKPPPNALRTPSTPSKSATSAYGTLRSSKRSVRALD